MYYVLGTGGRDYADPDEVYFEYDKILQRSELNMFCIQGGCATGVDFHIRQWCTFNEVPCLNWPARWNKGPKGGGEGPVRNGAMCRWLRDRIDLEAYAYSVHPHKMHKVMAFWDGESSETKSCIIEALSRDLNLEVFGPGKKLVDDIRKSLIQ